MWCLHGLFWVDRLLRSGRFWAVSVSGRVVRGYGHGRDVLRYIVWWVWSLVGPGKFPARHSCLTRIVGLVAVF